MKSTIKKITISDVLLQLITDKGLTVTELARRTLLPQPTIHRITSGVHLRPHKRTLEVLANFFTISIDQLCGIEPLDKKFAAAQNDNYQIPIFDHGEIISGKNHKAKASEYLFINKQVDANSFAIKMLDSSMEPLIFKGSTLIVDPAKKPQYHSLVVVKLSACDELLVRQLVINGNNCYIRPLSHDFKKIDMVLLGKKDKILGTIIEVRFSC